jgi:hypothetical protein
MSSREEKPFEKNPQTCPGLRDFLQPKPSSSNVTFAAGTLKSGVMKTRLTVLNAERNGSVQTSRLLAWSTASMQTSAEG